VLVAIVLVSALRGSAKITPEREYQDAFLSWSEKYERVYSAVDFRQKYKTFKANYDFVQNHNVSRGFTVELNKFADLSSAEFARLYNGYRGASPRTLAVTPERVNQVNAATVDWRTKGAVTEVKNQGQCGSCWSFSATGSMEAAHFLAHAKLVSLSEENLCDCSQAEGNMGCNGGLMDYAFEYVIKNKGIDTEASYPYHAGNGQTGPCRFNRADVGATIDSYRDIASGSEPALETAVNSRPVSVAIDASHSSFQLYSGGVYNEPACSSTALDHGVLAVGYGVEGADHYWLVKNSWGADWGIQGYILMSKNKKNQCGIATAASYPIA